MSARPTRRPSSLVATEPPGRSTFGRRWIVAYVLLAVLAVLAALTVRINLTPSLPRGVYMVVPFGLARPGDDVLVCMPTGPQARLAIERGYIAPSTRDCDSGGVPLLKHAVAASGDTVALGSAGAFVCGRRIGPAPPERDGAGRPLQPRYGRWPLGADDLWLGSDIANGYDSRYLGPVPFRLVLGRAHLVLRF